MKSLDFTPLFRTAIGFDRRGRQMESAASTVEAAAYPPYNIEKRDEDSYRLTMVVAGFSRDDLTLTVQDNTLIVAGRVSGQVPKPEFLHRGIAGRHFERRFVLADHIVVEGANLQNGLLHVGLNRVVPEALKLRNIPIAAAAFAPPAEAMAMANDAGTTAQVSSTFWRAASP
jgi:molecular chaperone IbpA